MGFIVYIICASIILYFLAFQSGLEFETSTKFIMFLIMMFPFVIFPIGLKISEFKQTKSIENKNKEYNSLSPEEQKAYNENQRVEALKTEIDYTILVGGDTKKSVGSAVVRGAIGSALLGPVGLVGGAISGKNKSETTFTIIYKDGHREVKTVSKDSYEFERYASYLK